MVTNDHPGQKKIQAWIPLELWDKISLQYPNQTNAVTEGFKILLGDIPENPKISQDIPELRATIEGLKLLLQEKDERISDLKRETETLSTFVHYFKSLEYRRLEASTEEIKPVVKPHYEKPIVSPGEAHIVKDEREIVTQEPDEKPGKAHTGKGEKALIEKICKNCSQPFFTENPKKETCSSKCRSAYSRRKTVN